MDGVAPHERLRLAREACGEELSALSRRTGVRVHHLHAIENGRLEDLPPGIYARAAVRAFADAYRLDAAAVLSACEARLPAAGDPIDALARKCGLPPASVTAAVPKAPTSPSADWRTLAGATVDATAIGVLVVAIVGIVALAGRVSIGALNESAAPFALTGVGLACAYFAWFGGIQGTTLGGFVMHTAAPQRQPLTPREISARALPAATADGRAVVRFGLAAAGMGVRPRGSVRNAQPRARALSRLRSLDLSPARWSPANRPAAAQLPPPHRPRG